MGGFLVTQEEEATDDATKRLHNNSPSRLTLSSKKAYNILGKRERSLNRPYHGFGRHFVAFSRVFNIHTFVCNFFREPNAGITDKCMGN